MAKLKAKEFPQRTTLFKTPWRDKGGSVLTIPMNVSPENGGYISRWSPSWKDRFLLLLFPKWCVWLVVYGKSHPPVYLVCAKTVFNGKGKE